MLPAIEPVVLASNPQFEALYTDLCTKKLDDDGTSRLESKAVAERESFREELRKARIESAKRDLVREGLRELVYQREDLPDELRELVAVVAAAMGGEIADDDAEVVEEVNERFKEKAMPVADVLSKQFQQDGKTLSDLMAPSMSSILTSPTDDMASCVETLQTETCTAQTQAASSRLEVAHALNSIHHIARQVLERCIRLLEQTIHGSMARNAKAHAEYLCTVAEGMAKKLAVQHQQVVRQVYSADMTELLKLKTRQIAQEQVASKRQTKEAEEELKRYESMRGVEGLVEEYAQILAESGRIRREIEKLET